MTIRSGCVDTARKALNEFTGDELESYISHVQTLTIELQEQGVPFARQAAIKQVNKDHLEAIVDDSARAGRNITKFETIEAKIDRDIPPDAFLDKTAKNTDYNVETANNAAKQLLHTEAFGTLSKEEMTILETGEADDAIYSVADGGAHHDAMIKANGDALKDYITPRNVKLIKSDAMRASDMNHDRFFKSFYNSSKLVAMGKEAWVERMKQLIDIKETFKNTRDAIVDGEINMAKVDQKIGNTYDNIIQGNGALFTKATVARDMEKVEQQRHMFYKYKDWKSWGMANKEFGQGTLLKAWLNDINTSGNQIGMAEIFGSAPQMMWNEVRHLAVKKNPTVTAWSATQHQQADALFNNLLGVNKGATNPTIANYGASIRAVTSMSRLGLIVLRSFSDLSNIAGMNMRAGVGYWKPQIDAIVNAFDLMPGASRRNLARTMSSTIKAQLGTIARTSDTNGMGETLNKMSNKFFYALGLERWDRSNKFSAMAPVMERFGKDSSKSFEHLNRQQQSFLRRFNIDSIEWDGLRAKTQDHLFSTDNVTNMTDSEIKDLWSKTDKIIPLSDYRSALYRKVFAVFDTMQEFSILNPTAYSNMITTGNTRAGTIPGEIMRMFSQFKGYPIQTMRRVFVGGMQDMDGYQAKMMYGLNMSLGVIGLTTLSEALIAISKGYTPPNPLNMSNSERIKYYSKMVAGGMGVFASVLNDKTTSKSITASFFDTPSFKLITDPLATAISLVHGDLKGAKNNAREFANVANPFATIPVLSPFIDKMLGNKPYLEPGQHPIF